MCTALITRALNLAGLVLAGTAPRNLWSGRGQRGVARTIHDSRRAWLAPVGRLDPAVLSLRCSRRSKKSLVLVRMFASRGRDAQGTAVVRGAVFCPLASVAEKMDERGPRARRVHSNCDADSFTMASSDS